MTVDPMTAVGLLYIGISVICLIGIIYLITHKPTN